jgi:hypothetical protein
VSVTYRGEGVSGAQVSADGERAGPTGPDGTVSFAYDGTADLELEITRGELEVERTYRVENGALVPEEAERERGEGGDETGEEPEKPGEPGELNLSVVAGEPAPNATVTLEATVDGSPASGVQVFVDGNRAGATDADGRIDVTLDTGETEITAERGDLEAELGFEFDEEDDGEESDSAGNGNGAEDAGNGTDSPGDTPDDSRSGGEESDTEDDETDE